jgi:restriction system protein
LTVNDAISFDSLRIKEQYPPFAPPREITANYPKPSREQFLSAVKAPGLFGKIVPGAKAKHERALGEAEARYQAALNEYNMAAAERRARLDMLKADYDRSREAFILKRHQRNGEVDELESAYRAGEGEAIVAYSTMVLERSEYPDGFPRSFDSPTRLSLRNLLSNMSSRAWM